MTTLHRLAVLLFVSLLSTQNSFSQEPKKPNPSEEDDRFARIIERWIERNETERDFVRRAVQRGGELKSPDDFNQWFILLGGADDGWDRGRIQRGSVREIFDRVAWRLDTGSAVLSRDQVIGYAKQYWRKEKSPPWRDAPTFDAEDEAYSLFRRLDTNRDGYLSEQEMSPALRADLKKMDRNEDGWINYYEYRFHFAHRLDAVYREKQQKSDVPLPALPIAAPADPERPMVTRAGKLPVGLPAWFDQLDTDRDGQVALYEWRTANWTIDEFQAIDPNDDGFLEPDEILRLLAAPEKDGIRPYAYLMQKRFAEPKSPPK